MKGKMHHHMIRCVAFQSSFQCRRRSLSSEIEIVGLLASCDEKLPGIRRDTEIEAEDKVGLIEKGKTKRVF